MPTLREPASILVVDDDPGTLQSISDVLARCGHGVQTAREARAALELLTSSSVDAAILDLHLPDVSGLALLQAIKTSAPTTEIIIITGYASATTAIQAINSDVFGYLTKPFEMDHLLATIDKALAKQRAERALSERTRSLESLIDTAAVAIVSLDSAGCVTTWSKAAEVMFGWKEHEVLGQGAVQLAAEQPGSPAEILVAPHAAVAGPAGDDRVDHDPRPDGDAGVRAHGLHDTGGLVAQHHRVVDAGMAAGVDREVRVADGGGGDANDGLAAAGHRPGSRRDLEAAGRFQDGRPRQVTHAIASITSRP